jgi:dimethylamine/trimethylamine dehydrogenase
VIFDDDHYYMGGVLAELCAANGCQVTLVTTAPMVSPWTQFTLEQERIQRRLLQLGVRIVTRHSLVEIRAGSALLACSLTGALTEIPRQAVLLVTDRQPEDSLYHALKPALEAGSLEGLRLVGDAEAPATIAQAVFSGHLAARQFDEPPPEGTPFKIERMPVDPAELPS